MNLYSVLIDLEEIKENLKAVEECFSIYIVEAIKRGDGKIFSDIEENLNSKYLFNLIFENCYYVLQEYMINIEEFFSCYTEEISYRYNRFEIKDSFKMLIYYYLLTTLELNFEIEKKKESNINFENALEKYIKFSEKHNKIDKNNEKVNLRRNLKKNKEKFEKLSPNNEFELLFRKEIKKGEKYEINSDLSNLFLYTLENINNCNINYEKYSYNKFKKFHKEYYENNLLISDVYFFEKIYNTMFINEVYTKIYLNNFYEFDKNIFVAGLIPLIYLDNPIINNYIINFLLHIYSNFYIKREEKFIEEFRIFLKYLIGYVFPLFKTLVFYIIFCEYNLSETMLFDNLKQEEHNTWKYDEFMENIKDGNFKNINKEIIDIKFNKNVKLEDLFHLLSNFNKKDFKAKKEFINFIIKEIIKTDIKEEVYT